MPLLNIPSSHYSHELTFCTLLWLSDTFPLIELDVWSGRSADSGVMSTDEALRSLKTELERCLKKCQDKSQQITKLQGELKTCRASLAENNVTLEQAQKELQETKSKVLCDCLLYY